MMRTAIFWWLLLLNCSGIIAMQLVESGVQSMKRRLATRRLRNAVDGLHLSDNEPSIEAACAAIKGGADVNGRDHNHNRFITAACKARCTQLVKELVAHQANVNTIEEGDFPPLVAACANPGASLELVRCLVDAQADIHAPNILQGAARYAPWGESLAIFHYLLGRGIPVNQPNKHGLTPLMYAHSIGYPVPIITLLLLDADPSISMPTMSSFGLEFPRLADARLWSPFIDTKSLSSLSKRELFAQLSKLTIENDSNGHPQPAQNVFKKMYKKRLKCLPKHKLPLDQACDASVLLLDDQLLKPVRRYLVQRIKGSKNTAGPADIVLDYCENIFPRSIAKEPPPKLKIPGSLNTTLKAKPSEQ